MRPMPLALVACAAAPSLADTIHLPADYATIQAAIAASSAGDEIVVADGEYTVAAGETISFPHDLTLRSASGSDACIIRRSGSAAARLMHIDAGRTAALVIEGLTLAGGLEADGGAIFIDGADPVFDSCTFEGNAAGLDDTADAHGGAVYVAAGSPTFLGCSFVENIARGWACDSDPMSFGGAVYIGAGTPDTDSRALFRGCRFIGNRADTTRCSDFNHAEGGAIYSNSKDVVVADCEFRGNTALGAQTTDGEYRGSGYGGAFYGYGTIDRSIFTANRSYGGGAVFGREAGIYGCEFQANAAVRDCGG